MDKIYNKKTPINIMHKNASRINKSGKQNKNIATVNICASVSVLKMAAMRWQKMGTTVKNGQRKKGGDREEREQRYRQNKLGKSRGNMVVFL